MKRRAFIKTGSLATAGGLTVMNLPYIEEQNASFVPDKEGFKSSFVRISKENPYYFELTNGDYYIPIGANICGASDISTMESYFRKLSGNGGNFLRIWLSNPIFEIEKPGGKGINEEVVANVDKIFALAQDLDIKMKMCIHSFRQIAPTGGSFNRPDLFRDNGGPFTSMTDYINSDAGRKNFLSRVEFFRNRYGNHPAVFGWELWNEMNAIQCENSDMLEWNKYMLREVHKKFPENLVLQSMGSFDMEKYRELFYRPANCMPDNDVAQVHRYLDMGASLDICKGPIDMLASDAIEELRSYHVEKPILLAETGAVMPRHSGSSELYPLDKDGTLLHDMLFAPFFSGAAGPGHSWHWGGYIDKNDLWYHFRRFSECVKGVNPIKERFIPVKIFYPNMRIYVLVGKKTILAWCRDIESNWINELSKGLVPGLMHDISIDLTNLVQKKSIRQVSFYNPWNDEWIMAKNDNLIMLPDFKRSIVVKIEKIS